MPVSSLCTNSEHIRTSFNSCHRSPLTLPPPMPGIYAASKAALHSLTEVLRMEVKPLGINVMLVAPGGITSGFGDKQNNSFRLPEDSLYRSVEPFIRARAEMSQKDSQFPTSSFPCQEGPTYAAAFAEALRCLQSTPCPR